MAAVADQVARPAGKPASRLKNRGKTRTISIRPRTWPRARRWRNARAREIHIKDAEVEAQNYSAAISRNKVAIAAANAAAVKAKDAQDKATADAAVIRRPAAARTVRPLAVRFSADMQTVAAVLSDGSLRSGLSLPACPSSTFRLRADNGGFPRGLRDGVFAACTADGSTSARHHVALGPGADAWRRIDASPFVDRVNALRFSPDGKTLAAGGGEPTRSGDISLWDVASGKLINEWKERHSDAVVSFDF